MTDEEAEIIGRMMRKYLNVPDSERLRFTDTDLTRVIKEMSLEDYMEARVALKNLPYLREG
jgi:hypothetical protein